MIPQEVLATTGHKLWLVLIPRFYNASHRFSHSPDEKAALFDLFKFPFVIKNLDSCCSEELNLQRSSSSFPFKKRPLSPLGGSETNYMSNSSYYISAVRSLNFHYNEQIWAD